MQAPSAPGSPAFIEALLDPRAYPHRVTRVELIETHISWVFLAGVRAYKLKKPVNLGFRDFTTLDRRRFFCEEAVRLTTRRRRTRKASFASMRPVRPPWPPGECSRRSASSRPPRGRSSDEPPRGPSV